MLLEKKKGTTEPINASNFASEILSIQGGASLNVAYGTTPPTDTSKIWLQCAEPQGVEVQNYLGEVSVSNVANWGVISNPVNNSSRFDSELFSSCYIGNNQIAIVGQNHIRIYNLTTKAYITDYTINVGTSNYYTNVIYKDNVLYFGYDVYLYSYDLSTQTLTQLIGLSSHSHKYLFFNSENEIDYISYYSSNGQRYRYNLTDNTNIKVITFPSSSYRYFSCMSSQQNIVKAGDYLYSFAFNNSNSTAYYCKIDLINNTVTALSSFKDFIINNFGNSYGALLILSTIADSEERYIYIIGGGYTGASYDNIIKYDTINDTCELLDKKLLKGKYACFSLLVDNRVYMFGGMESGTSYGRQNNLDYFDLQYPLTQNNAIITTNTINTDNTLPLINTEKLKLNSNVASAYKGNANNLAEKVNAYHHNGYGWAGINCDDYREE